MRIFNSPFSMLHCASAVMALALAACTEEYPLQDATPSANSNASEVSFRPLTQKTATKAPVTTVASMTGFTVSALYRDTSANPSNYVTTPLFDALNVHRSEAGLADAWEYAPKKLWPDKAAVDFFAYAPASSRHLTQGLGGLNGSGSPVIKYSVPQTDNKKGTATQEDFLVAVNQGRYASGGKVQLLFQHALSRVLFEARSNVKGLNLAIQSIRLRNLYASGELQLDTVHIPADRGFDYDHKTNGDIYHTWTSPSAATDFPVDFSKAPVLVSYTPAGTYTAVIPQANGLMVLPQETTLWDGTSQLSNQFAVEVQYAAVEDDGTGISHTQDFPVKDLVDRNRGIVFEMGRQYVFQMSLLSGNAASPVIEFGVGLQDFVSLPQDSIPLPQTKTRAFFSAGPGSRSLPLAQLTRATRAAAESLVTVDSVWIKNAKVEDGKLTFELDTNDIAADRIGHINIRGRGIDLELEVAQTPFAFDAATGTLGHYAGSEVTVSIPAELDGVPVLSIGKENVDLQNDFGGDYALATATLPFFMNRRIRKVILPEGLEKIGDFAFYHIGVAKVIFPESLKKIGDYAFYGAALLKSITLPAGLTYIGEDAFARCALKDRLDLPAGISSLSDEAFANCSDLTGVNFPEGLTTMGRATFQGCINLTEVCFPKGLTNLGESTFLGCTGLTQVTFLGSKPTMSRPPFEGCSSLTTIYVKSLADWNNPNFGTATLVELPTP